MNLICPATPYNTTSVFHLLSRFCARVEKETKKESCRLGNYLLFVMDTFLERIRIDMETKTEQILNGSPDVWSSLSVIPTRNVVKFSE